MVDTGVFMRFLGERPEEPVSRECVKFCQAMCSTGRELFVAAPTIAELMRQRGQPIPHVKGITVVAFDERAATILGLRMPMAKLHAVKTSTGLSHTYLKYDAMIAACALRCNASTMVAIDGDHVALLRDLAVAVRHPKDFLDKQGRFAFEDEASD
ncbi:hypothetical protein [Nannocystis bainbridge]|uniref:PIN domain-containing protein n=1 Tax=Nannocystis bainbridge TaxID=2995303 RepID=A0ABT5E9L6_9BACT|nr:hypothetical protein [Nannocystis bainbridge]MDC0722549.1 hypothetical protein [Nannocystis bainbridge]